MLQVRLSLGSLQFASLDSAFEDNISLKNVQIKITLKKINTLHELKLSSMGLKLGEYAGRNSSLQL